MKNFSEQTFAGEIKPVATEFEYREKSFLLNVFELSDCRYDCEKTRKWFVIHFLPQMAKFQLRLRRKK